MSQKTYLFPLLSLIILMLSVLTIELPLKPWNPQNSKFVKFFASGSNNGAFTFAEINSIMGQLVEEYSSILQEEVIGQSYQKREIKAYFLNSTPFKKGETKSLFMMSGIHSNELVTYEQNLFLLMNLLGQEDANTEHKLNAGIQLILIPVFNVDGLALLSKLYEERHTYYKIRKNRDYEGEMDSKNPQNQGVDLNRNWDIKWSNKNEDPAVFRENSAEYHGTRPLSEPENQALKAFLDRHENTIRFMFSLHSYGNLFCIPFNSDSDPTNPQLIKQLPLKAEKYQFFKDHFHFPHGLIVNNAINTVQYVTTGELTDYVAKTYKHIVVVSPEAGTDKWNSRRQDPGPEALLDVMQANYPWMRDVLRLMQGAIIVKEAVLNEKNEAHITLKNIGVRAYVSHTANITSLESGVSVALDEIKIEPEKEQHIVKSVGSINRTDELVLYLSLYSDKYAESEFLKIELKRDPQIKKHNVEDANKEKSQSRGIIVLIFVVVGIVAILTVFLVRRHLKRRRVYQQTLSSEDSDVVSNI